MQPPAGGRQFVRATGLHSLIYCERLFYLEEVEEIRLADQAVYAGRTLHQRWQEPDATGTELRGLELVSEGLGLHGFIDAVRTREGKLVPYEHKRGRPHFGETGQPEAWDTDAVQLGGYALLLEEALGEPILEGRVRYHAANQTVRVPITPVLRGRVRQAIARALELASSAERPPVIDDERKSSRCSLAPVCLPEEERFARGQRRPARLFPENDEREVLHVVAPGSHVRREGDRLVVHGDAAGTVNLPVRQLQSVILHGGTQISTQALHLCADRDVGVHWLTAGGRYIAGLAPGAGGVQRRLRQYAALTERGLVLRLGRRLADARVASQLWFLHRATRGDPCLRESVSLAIEGIRARQAAIPRSESIAEFRGHEGAAGRFYFEALPLLLPAPLRDSLAPHGRSRRPPQDPFNAALSFGYALLYGRVLGNVIAVGLDPAIGFFHSPRSAAYPLVLDLMELFRVALVDMVIVASINRRQWTHEHFAITREKTWLSESGRRLCIDLVEHPLEDVWKHPVLDYSLSYARAIELEARLLEKEWSGQPGLFARGRLR